MLRSIKSKVVSKSSTTTEVKDQRKRSWSTVIAGLQMTLRIVTEATANSGVPGLQTGLSSLLLVLDVIKKSSQNIEDVEKLAQQIAGLNTFLGNMKSGVGFPQAVIERIGRLSIQLSKVSEELGVMASRHAIGRFIHYDDDAQAIHGHIQSITWSIQNFTVETTLAIEFALEEHAVRIQGTLENLRETTKSEFQKMSTKLDIKDGLPPHAIFSGFDCKQDRSRCWEDTRVDILDQVFRWIDTGDTQFGEGHGLQGEPNNPGVTQKNSCIFWINGSGGTGKTTIAYTVADHCRKRKILGASFFCSRDDAECSNPSLIFTTIAYQLGNFNSKFKDEVSRVMSSNPDIGYSSVPYQLEQLIINPLLSLDGSFPACVVVVDALDECKDSGTTSIILSSLSRHVTELFPLKFLVTSRPEHNVTTAFKSKTLGPATQRLILHEVELDVVQNDIEHFLSSRLALTRESHCLHENWPAMEDIHALAQLSFGLFIFAATSVKFIEDRNYSNPTGQLAGLLRNTPILPESSSPHYRLDQLYSQVLTQAFPAISPHHSGRLKMVLGSIVLIRDPLSPLSLEELLGLTSSTVRQTLMHLHSVVIVPEDDSRAIRLLHPSFFDYITSPTRCQNPKFVVNIETQHTLLARVCLETMTGLRRDICGINDLSVLNSEVNDLPSRIETNIPAHLRYACRHWAWHLTNGMFSEVLLDLVREFCSKRLLYWVEACSLLGELRNALLSLNSAHKAIFKVGRNLNDTLQLLRDCGRFTLEFFPIISTCALQVYCSALLFTPRDTLIWKTYGGCLDVSVKLYDGMDESWNPCTRTMEGHSDGINSVAFSPDGTCVLSGSFDDTLRLWDAVSGAHLNTCVIPRLGVESVAFSPDGARFASGSTLICLWDAASGEVLNSIRYIGVLSVAFSPDGTLVASGSRDNILCLWDAVSGALLKTLRGHSLDVDSVAFSPDGTRVVSGSHDRTLRLWDVGGGAHLNTLCGHSDRVLSVAFSPNSTCVASGSDDFTLRLWDAVSGTPLKCFSGHSDCVWSVAFSPDGTRLVSGSGDNTLRLWDVANGTHLRTLHGHSDDVRSVAFSPDGAYIVSGSMDNTLRLWDVGSGAHPGKFNGHPGTVRFIAFSPDATRVVASYDNTLLLWDATSGVRLKNLIEHSDWVCYVAFSPDSTRFVSASNDDTLRLWDAASGAHRKTLSGHLGKINAVAFSPDGTCVASGSSDHTLRLWDPASGAHRMTLRGHFYAINSVAFSPDSTRIVSGSLDKTLRLWDLVSGAPLRTFHGHATQVWSVAFSPDGTRIVSGSDDCTLRLWDAVSGLHLEMFKGHSNTIRSVSFSPDGTCIVSGSDDNTLRLWDAVRGGQLKQLMGHRSLVHSLARSCGTSFSQTSTIKASWSTSPVFGYLAEDGWIHSITQNRRLCWVPVSCRPITLDTFKDRVVFGTADGHVVDINAMNSRTLV